jgi:hypothetical protein
LPGSHRPEHDRSADLVQGERLVLMSVTRRPT